MRDPRNLDKVAAITGADSGSDAAMAERVVDRYGCFDMVGVNGGVQQFGATAESSARGQDWVMLVGSGGVVNGVAAFLPRRRQVTPPRHVVVTSPTGFHQIGIRMVACIVSRFAAISMTARLTLRIGRLPHG